MGTYDHNWTDEEWADHEASGGIPRHWCAAYDAVVAQYGPDDMMGLAEWVEMQEARQRDAAEITTDTLLEADSEMWQEVGLTLTDREATVMVGFLCAHGMWDAARSVYEATQRDDNGEMNR